jgi:hypothetical protein
MPMKISLALGPRQPLSRQTAWGCFTTNLATPGFGSLLAGRVSGYPQAALYLLGFGLTLMFGARFALWYLANWSRLRGPEADPVESLGEILLAVRWPFLGFAIFAIAWLWALATSLQILRAAKKSDSPRTPPRL